MADTANEREGMRQLVGRTFRSGTGNLWRVEADNGETVRVHRLHEDGRYADDPVGGGYWWHWQSLFEAGMEEVMSWAY